MTLNGPSLGQIDAITNESVVPILKRCAEFPAPDTAFQRASAQKLAHNDPQMIKERHTTPAFLAFTLRD
jgi:hypothetical protein